MIYNPCQTAFPAGMLPRSQSETGRPEQRLQPRTVMWPHERRGTNDCIQWAVCVCVRRCSLCLCVCDISQRHSWGAVRQCVCRLCQAECSQPQPARGLSPCYWSEHEKCVGQTVECRHYVQHWYNPVCVCVCLSMRCVGACVFLSSISVCFWEHPRCQNTGANTEITRLLIAASVPSLKTRRVPLYTIAEWP